MRDLTDLLAAIAALPVDALAADERAAFAQRWADDALDEHASIAAFSRFSLELLAVGAPPSLVAAAHEAALDEIAHARCSFALASRYRGESVGPGPLVPAGLVCTDIVELVRATVREGCAGETAAAMIAAAERDACVIEPVRTVHAMIAEDEARHAALAWRFVAWAIDTHGAPALCALDDSLPAPSEALDERARIANVALEMIRERRAALLRDPDRVLTELVGAHR